MVSGEPKTTRELRHYIALTKAELECSTAADASINEHCAAVSAQLSQVISNQ